MPWQPQRRGFGSEEAIPRHAHRRSVSLPQDPSGAMMLSMRSCRLEMARTLAHADRASRGKPHGNFGSARVPG